MATLKKEYGIRYGDKIHDPLSEESADNYVNFWEATDVACVKVERVASEWQESK